MSVQCLSPRELGAIGAFVLTMVDASGTTVATVMEHLSMANERAYAARYGEPVVSHTTYREIGRHMRARVDVAASEAIGLVDKLVYNLNAFDMTSIETRCLYDVFTALAEGLPEGTSAVLRTLCRRIHKLGAAGELPEVRMLVLRRFRRAADNIRRAGTMERAA